MIKVETEEGAYLIDKMRRVITMPDGNQELFADIIPPRPQLGLPLTIIWDSAESVEDSFTTGLVNFIAHRVGR